MKPFFAIVLIATLFSSQVYAGPAAAGICYAGNFFLFEVFLLDFSF